MKRLITIFFAIAAGLIIFPQCGHNHPKPLVAHPVVNSGFNKLSRQAQVQECARCHRQEYENELKGPHANSYKMLAKHVDYIHGASYECQYYTKFVDKTEKQSCINCHAANNLYQTYYAAYLSNPDSLINRWKAGNVSFPTARTDKKSYVTGIDCLTCHYDGNSVVTTSGYKATAGVTSPAYCSPKASKLFSSDYNCIACHISGMTTDHSIYASATATTSCVSCHQQYDAAGKGTHYYYWRHDSIDKPKPKSLAAFYAPSHANLKKGKVTAYWQNTSMPHQMSDCPEWVIELTVVDKNNKTWGSKKMYLNCKDFHDKSMQQAFGNNILPGVNGINPVYNQPPTAIEIPLFKNAPQNNLRLHCSTFSKPQYWLNDSIGVLQNSSILAIR